MDITPKVVDIPQTFVERKPNPMQPIVDALLKDEGKALAFELPAKTAADEKGIETAVGQIQKAAREADRSARKKVEREDGKATVTVWLVERITRTVKPAAE